METDKLPKKLLNEAKENESDIEEESNDEINSDTDENDNADNESTSEDSNDDCENSNEVLDSSNVTNTTGNSGWADAMQKILKSNKPKKKKTIVLSRAKKLSDIKNKKTEDIKPTFEIDNTKEIKEDPDKNEESEEEQPTKRRRKESYLGIRIKPTVFDRDREKILQKIATKGVVQLFNAVKNQQMEIDKKLSEAGPTERKREQVLKSIDKNSFLDVLMGNSKSISVEDDVKKEEVMKQNEKKNNDNVWSVLRDDFVMGAKMKDWDKKSESSENSSEPEGIDSDNE